MEFTVCTLNCYIFLSACTVLELYCFIFLSNIPTELLKNHLTNCFPLKTRKKISMQTRIRVCMHVRLFGTLEYFSGFLPRPWRWKPLGKMFSSKARIMSELLRVFNKFQPFVLYTLTPSVLTTSKSFRSPKNLFSFTYSYQKVITAKTFKSKSASETWLGYRIKIKNVLIKFAYGRHTEYHWCSKKGLRLEQRQY